MTMASPKATPSPIPQLRSVSNRGQRSTEQHIQSTHRKGLNAYTPKQPRVYTVTISNNHPEGILTGLDDHPTIYCHTNERGIQ